MALFQTDKHDYTTVDDRVWQHPGPIVDLGCDPWDWSRCFVGKKRVIGADPFATQIEGTELFKGVIGATHCTVNITCEGDASTILRQGTKPVHMITWAEFKAMFGISQIALLKMNIEGSEYALLNAMTDADFAEIDQIAVSFHHWLWPEFERLTQACVQKLINAGFTMRKTNVPWCWWLGVK